MNVTSFLAWKFLFGKGRNVLVSFLTWMAVFGVLLSVMAFIVVQSVTSGFGKDLREKVMGFSPSVTLFMKSQEEISPAWEEKIRSERGVEKVARFLEGEAILRTEDEDTQGVRVRGMDPKSFPQGKDFQVFFEEGEGWEELKGSEGAEPGILLGKELASSLGVLPFLMEKVELLYPFGEVGPSGEVEPNVRTFRVIGTFKSGYYEYDSKVALVDLPEARRVFGSYQPEQVGIFLKDSSIPPSFLGFLKNVPGVDKIKTWQELHARLFSALRLERAGMAIVMVLVVLLASFNILSMLTMVAYERRKEIAVLQALGLRPAQIRGLFYKAGLWISLLGGVLGALAGTGLCLLLQRLPIPLPSPYYLDSLPVEIRGSTLLVAILLALGVSLVATLYPAHESRSLNVVEALHYE